jgi:hypothetical protein
MPKDNLKIPDRRGGRRLGAGRKTKASPIKRSARNNRKRVAWRRDRLKLADLDNKIQNFAQSNKLSEEYKSLIAERETLALKLVIRNRKSVTAEDESSANFAEEPSLEVSTLSSDSDEVLSFQLQIISRNYRACHRGS